MGVRSGNDFSTKKKHCVVRCAVFDTRLVRGRTSGCAADSLVHVKEDVAATVAVSLDSRFLRARHVQVVVGQPRLLLHVVHVADVMACGWRRNHIHWSILEREQVMMDRGAFKVGGKGEESSFHRLAGSRSVNVTSLCVTELLNNIEHQCERTCTFGQQPAPPPIY